MTPRCGGWRSGQRAIRRPLRRCAEIFGARRTAPTDFSSTSKARRTCSAARRNYSPIFPPGSKASACRRDSPSLLRPARPGRWRAFTPRPLSFYHRDRKTKPWRPCPSKRYGFRWKLARRCAGSVLNPSARCSINRARLLLRDFRRSCCGVLTRRSAASTSRSSLSSRRRSITRCVICSNLSSRRKLPWRSQRVSCKRLCTYSPATMSERARCGFRSIASMARSGRSISR